MLLTSRDWRHLTAIVVAAASLYFATFVGVTSSNDGSHYALVRALVDRGSFEISPYLAFAEHQDYAVHGDRRYSDRPPGTALWAAPFYAAAAALPAPTITPPSKHDRGNPQLMGIAAATAIAGALAVALFWLVARERFGLGLYASDLAAIGLAVGTPHWKYSSLLYSHSLSALALLTAFYLALRLARRPTPLVSGACGLALGASFAVEYTNALAVVLVGLFAAGASLLRSGVGRQAIGTVAALLVGGIVPVAGLLGYNWINFGGPLALSFFQVDLARWPNAASYGSAFATPLAEGLVGMLWWGSQNQGLFLLSPVAWLALVGMPAFWRAERAACLLALALFLAALLLFSRSTNFNPLTNDGRYLTPFLGLWLFGMAFWIDRTHERFRGEGARLVANLALFGLLFLSMRNQFALVAFSWNHDLRLEQLAEESVALPNLRLLFRTVFPNALNLWWFWLLMAPPLLLAWVARSAVTWPALARRRAA